MRLLHFADLHLGVENYGHIDPTTGLHTRLADFVGSFRFVIDLALSEHVDAVLFAGDAYKTPTPSPTWQREFAEQLHRLYRAGIPAILVVGNHDAPASFGRATSVDIFSALELSNTHVIRIPALLHIETSSGPLQVAGLPWPTRHFLRTDDRYKQFDGESLTETIQQMCADQIEEFAGSLDASVPSVLVAHTTAADATYSGSERTAVIGADPVLKTGTLANLAFDYVALGHIHKHQDLNLGRSPPVVYSGSVDRIDFGEEGDEKGCCLVTIKDESGSKSTSYEFVRTPARRFVTVDVEADESETNPTAAVLEALADANVTDAIVRIIYSVSNVGTGHTLDSQRILGALQAAYHVAGIFPKRRALERQRRASVSEEMLLTQALDRYIDNTPELVEIRSELQKYAAELERQLELNDTRSQD